jgi:hypothetical protein
MLRQLGFPATVLSEDLESIYAAHLLDLIRSSSFDAAVLLAHERVYDSDGTVRQDLGSMYVPNDVVLDLAATHPEFLAGVSIHPARSDALEELDRCLERGAVLMKCLPNCQNIDCSDPRYQPFGSAWRRRLPLSPLSPAAKHRSGSQRVWLIPRLLRIPLECGVTVIAAHCATKSGLGSRLL